MITEVGWREQDLASAPLFTTVYTTNKVNHRPPSPHLPRRAQGPWYRKAHDALVVDDRGKVQVLGRTQHAPNRALQGRQHCLDAKAVTSNLHKHTTHKHTTHLLAHNAQAHNAHTHTTHLHTTHTRTQRACTHALACTHAHEGAPAWGAFLTLKSAVMLSS